MKNLQKVIAITVASFSLAAFTQANAATIITQWTYESLITTGVNTNPATSTGSGTTTPIGMTLNGSAENTGISSIQGTDTNPNNTSPTNNVLKVRGNGSGGKIGWDPAEAIGTQGVQFSVNTTNYTGITASFDWYPSTNGEAKLQLQYTIDGTTWIDAPASDLMIPSGSISIVTNMTPGNNLVGSYIDVTAGNTWYNDITLTLNGVAGVNNDASFGIRLLNAATGSADVEASSSSTEISNTSGNWSFDNVTISGTVATPEPGTYALLIVGFAALVIYQRRRKQSSAQG